MKPEKIRNLTEPELKHEERELNDQLFRLKFQMKMGQTESLKKIRGLRKDIARVKTIARQQELAGANGAKPVASEKPAAKAGTKSTKKTAEKKTASARK